MSIEAFDKTLSNQRDPSATIPGIGLTLNRMMVPTSRIHAEENGVTAAPYILDDVTTANGEDDSELLNRQAF